jgi:hypothetical protein
MKRTSTIFLLAAIIFSISFSSCKETGIKLKTTPEAFLQKMENNPAFKTSPAGEGFCWNARANMEDFIDNYLLTKDKKWLDAGVKYYDWLLSRMDTDPDGYKGWIGQGGRGRKVFMDALVGDAILFSGILDFSVLVLENDTLKGTYGAKAKSYVDAAKRDFVEKWDRRGSWVEDGPYSSYIGAGAFTKTDSTKTWVPKTQPGMSNPQNKLFDAAEVLLRLWRITKDKVYWNKAEKIFYTAKSHFQFHDNHYCWNYFEPLTPGDVDLAKMDTRHGIWVHPWRSGYQASEIDKIVEAYHYGMVFDKQDIERIINTNLKVMWNGDKVNPKFIGSNGLGADGDTVGLASFKKTYGHSNVVKNSGELWTGLLDFDQTIRDLYELQFKDKNSLEYIRYKYKYSNPPSFKRKYAKDDVTVPVINFTESKDLYCAVALPHKIAKGSKTILVCKSMKGGDLQIDLYSKEGQKICNLHSGKIGENTFIKEWDCKDPAKKATFKGDYNIRWTTSGGYREFPIVIE